MRRLFHHPKRTQRRPGPAANSLARNREESSIRSSPTGFSIVAGRPSRVDHGQAGIDGPAPQRRNLRICDLPFGRERTARPEHKSLRAPYRSFRRDRPDRGLAARLRRQLMPAPREMKFSGRRPRCRHPRGESRRAHPRPRRNEARPATPPNRDESSSGCRRARSLVPVSTPTRSRRAAAGRRPERQAISWWSRSAAPDDSEEISVIPGVPHLQLRDSTKPPGSPREPPCPATRSTEHAIRC